MLRRPAVRGAGRHLWKGCLVNPVISPVATRNSILAHVLSWGTVRAWPEEIAGWRKQPRPMPPEPFSPSLIRHSVDPVVAGLWATCVATSGLDAKPGDFASWAIVAAPRMMARDGTAVALERYRQEGPWGISPHLIPNHSLHAVSGTISQILKSHGPNFGVGNGPHPSCEGWLAAATLLSEGAWPGVWLVLTSHSDESPPPQGDAPRQRVECEAVALALAPPAGETSGLHLRLCPEELVGRPDDAFLASIPEFSLGSFIDELSRRDAAPAGLWRLPGAGWIEIETR